MAEAPMTNIAWGNVATVLENVNPKSIGDRMEPLQSKVKKKKKASRVEDNGVIP